MKNSKRSPLRRRRRRIGEQAVQSLAISSQIGLLYPPGIDEWMRRELGCEACAGKQRASGAR